MCNIEQCSRCRLNFNDCGHYDNADSAPCSNYVKPINNSKMFARWYKFSGRIGRLEYVLTLIISVVLYFFVLLGVGQFIQAIGITIDTTAGIYIFTLCAMIPSVYLMLAAGVKRTHDTRVSVWYALIPVVVALCLMLGIIPGIIPILIGVAGCKPKGRFFRFVFQYLIEIQTHTAHQIYKKMRLCGMNVRYHIGKCL